MTALTIPLNGTKTILTTMWILSVILFLIGFLVEPKLILAGILWSIVSFIMTNISYDIVRFKN